MNNSSHKANKVSVALLAAVLAVSASFASVMTGCGCEKESSSTGATVSDTTSATLQNNSTTKANEKSESEQSSQSSNTESSNAQSSQTSEKSESEVLSESSKTESKAETSKSETSSKASDKTSSNSSNNSSANNNPSKDSGEDITLDLKKGNTITVTYSVKSTVVLTNYQATITYDSSKLKVKKAELQKPATSNGIINAKQSGKIFFNGSDITTGYDYTQGGNLVVVTFEATDDGTTTIDWLWQSASTLDEKNNIISHIDNNGKSDGTVTLSTSYK